ncbi:hepatic and glial cell adhesion molecule-like [Mobula birostris]|uniref:hepatic and glial cell adhesion molecule-like n=1 Tax=Mobula birostris TaxID=1983395 RepID=UPI003B28674A
MFKVLSALHFLTFCGSEISAQPDTTIDAVVGQDVHFPLENQCEAQLVVTFLLLSPVAAALASRGTNMSESQHPLYKDRLYWSANGSPVLSNVRVNDSKRYETQIDCFHKSSPGTTKMIYDLHVFEPVSKPLITKTGNCSSPNIALRCSASNGINVSFNWRILSLSGGINGTFDGPELVISNVTEEEKYIFRCTAKNRVSNASTEQTITELCNGKEFACQKCHSFFLAATLPLVAGLIMFICCKAKQAIGNKGNKE